MDNFLEHHHHLHNKPRIRDISTKRPTRGDEVEAEVSQPGSINHHEQAYEGESNARCLLTITTRNDPTTTVRHHIRLLHEYNEIKDIGQGLMGLIADARGMRQVEVQEEFGVSSED